MLFHRAVGTTSAFPEFHKPLHALPLAVDLGRKPEERIGSLMPLAKIKVWRSGVLSSAQALLCVLCSSQSSTELHPFLRGSCCHL